MGDKMNEQYIMEIIKMAEKAFRCNEIPVGCIIVKNGEIISRGYNVKENNKTIFGHAEIIAIKKAEKELGDWRLNDCELYTTLFPCPMCASAIQQSRISKVYYILPSNNNEAFKISKKILNNKQLNHNVKIKQINVSFDAFDIFFKSIRKKMFHVKHN